MQEQMRPLSWQSLCRRERDQGNTDDHERATFRFELFALVLQGAQTADNDFGIVGETKAVDPVNGFEPSGRE